MLYGLDRFSEDLDFSLLKKGDGFDLANYSESLKRELASFGFAVEIESRKKQAQTAVQSAFLKADTRTQMIMVEFERGLVQRVPRNQVLKIKLEVDTDPPQRRFNRVLRYQFELDENVIAKELERTPTKYPEPFPSDARRVMFIIDHAEGVARKAWSRILAPPVRAHPGRCRRQLRFDQRHGM